MKRTSSRLRIVETRLKTLANILQLMGHSGLGKNMCFAESSLLENCQTWIMSSLLKCTTWLGTMALTMDFLVSRTTLKTIKISTLFTCGMFCCLLSLVLFPRWKLVKHHAKLQHKIRWLVAEKEEKWQTIIFICTWKIALQLTFEPLLWTSLSEK